MKLSDNFQLWEFLRSQTAIEKDFREQFHPPSDVIDNLRQLAKEVLQLARIRWDNYIYITSGYRCKRVNDAVGGVSNSDHLNGKAADITCKDVEGLYVLIKGMELPYKQLIWYKERNFIHVSYDKDEIKRQHWTT